MTVDSHPPIRWFYLALATSCQAAVAMIRLGLPALMPLVRDEFALDRAQVGLVTSLTNMGAAAAGVPAGKMVDRVGERLVIVCGNIISGLVVLGVLGATDFGLLMAVFLAAGFSTTVSVPAGGVLIQRWFSRHERGMAMGVRQTGIPIGGALAALILPSVAMTTDWRTALSLAGAVAIVLGAAFAYLYREPPSEPRYISARESNGLFSLLRRKEVSALALFSFAFGGAQWCFLTYISLYLTDTLGASVLLAGTVLGVAQMAGAGGRIIWGMVSDRLFRGSRVPVLLVISLVAITATVAMALSSAQTPFVVVAGLAAVLGFTLQGWNGLPHVLAPELAGPRAAGLAVGLVNSAGFVGVIVFPPVFGYLVDATGSYRAAWMALIVLAMASISVLPPVWKAEVAATRATSTPAVTSP